MMKKSKEVDVYISKSERFAKPILKHLRVLVHFACPEIEETIKWGFPHFMYNGILCSMASFNNHCAFGFWKGKFIPQLEIIINENGESAMGNFGRITSLAELPNDKIILNIIEQAVVLNNSNIKLPPRTKINSSALRVNIPDFILNEINKNKLAKFNFEKFTVSKRKEYVEWILEAKTVTTKKKRLQKTVEWLAEGKSRNWKYEK